MTVQETNHALRQINHALRLRLAGALRLLSVALLLNVVLNVVLLLAAVPASANIAVTASITSVDTSAHTLTLHYSWKATGADHVYDFNLGCGTYGSGYNVYYDFLPAQTGYPEPAYDPPDDSDGYDATVPLPGGDAVYEIDFLTDYQQGLTALVSIPLHVNWAHPALSSGGVALGTFNCTGIIGADTMAQSEQDLLQWGYTSLGVAALVLLCFAAGGVLLRWLKLRATSS